MDHRGTALVALGQRPPAAVRPDRRGAVRRAMVLARATIGWNVGEGAVAVAAGAAAGSISLIGSGLDSAIEVSAAAVLAWRLRQERRAVARLAPTVARRG